MEGGGAPPLPMHPWGGGVHNSWLVTAQYNRVSTFLMWPVDGGLFVFWVGRVGWGGGGGRLTGWWFRVYVCVHLLRRQLSARGLVGWLSTHWVGGEGGVFKNCERCGAAHDAAVTMSPFWNCPTR